MRPYRFPLILLAMTAACGSDGTLEIEDSDGTAVATTDELVSDLRTCGAVIDAKSDMRATTGQAGSQGWSLWSNGALKFSAPIAAQRAMTVRAKGSFGKGGWPQMEVRMGARVIATHRVDQDLLDLL